jgi:hypothetical protein
VSEFSTTSDVTRSVCERIGFIFETGFVQTREQNGVVIVAGTFGKPEEFRSLSDKVLGLGKGFAYEGIDGGTVYGREMSESTKQFLAELEKDEREYEESMAREGEAWWKAQGRA